MLSFVNTANISGLETIKIRVEVNLTRGKPQLVIIGLASKTIEESKERITSALINSGIRPKSQRTIVNLAPADVKKSGSLFDLAILIGILKSYEKIIFNTDDAMFFGELSLNGEVKKINGILPLVIAAKEMKIKKVFIPFDNCNEVSLISGIEIYPIKHINELILKKDIDLPKRIESLKFQYGKLVDIENETNIDFADIYGQKIAKRSLEIAAAGGHNLLMVGPPGSGKSMLAKALVGILPPLTEQETTETTKIYSVSGLLKNNFIRSRPIRSPHHTISRTGMVGGGNIIKPGEISLAHNGILFLDEFSEFPKHVIESLRQPMEEGIVSISRASGTVKYPSKFTLIAASNPCPCGYKNSEVYECICNDNMTQQFRKKISGPIMDRIDLTIFVKSVEIKKITEAHLSTNVNSKTVYERVAKARIKQNERFGGTKITINSQLSSKQVRKFCILSTAAEKLLKQASIKLKISTRSYFKIIKISQTIADLDDRNQKIIEEKHIAEALQYRQKIL
ncbi:YifB family Mg chelatase-like AAA ATPase [Candidatus Woesebacteria bacterium]|nr:YifB family Mg chelatase-like AAA ATPase [Candidatus Woesebacteria bacterium]